MVRQQVKRDLKRIENEKKISYSCSRRGLYKKSLKWSFTDMSASVFYRLL
jgi:hypothetical protein